MQFHQPGAYFHQRTIRTFIQRSRLSLVARSSSGHRQFTDKYPHNLPTRSHASSCSDRRRRKYHFKQDTFRYHHPTETGRNHGFVNRYHHFGSQLWQSSRYGNQRLHRTIYHVTRKESFSRTYTTPLTTPNNLLSAGNSYLFRAVINENSISFANVSVKEWTEVDESGNPLYPVQD